jgi:hypothetical protein
MKSNQYCENWEHMGRVEHRTKSEASLFEYIISLQLGKKRSSWST